MCISSERTVFSLLNDVFNTVYTLLVYMLEQSPKHSTLRTMKYTMYTIHHSLVQCTNKSKYILNEYYSSIKLSSTCVNIELD